MFPQWLDHASMIATYASSKQRLLLFDYDGTLTPIVQDPAAAILAPEALRSIQTLAADPRNAVWIVSGRNQSFLEQMFGDTTEVGLVAEHGSFLRSPGSSAWEDLTAEVNMNWQEEVTKVFQRYNDQTPGSRIERKRAAVVWHFRQAEQDYAELQAAECKRYLESTVGKASPLEFVDGKCVLEARLRFVTKGHIAQRLVDESRTLGEPLGFVICFGDDVTDEDMFRALQQSGLPKDTVYTVTVNEIEKHSDAEWILSDPHDVVATIMMMNLSDDRCIAEAVARKPLPVPRSYLVGL